MEYKETYQGKVFTVNFMIGHPMRFSHKGKHFPITTQCVIKRNNFVIGIGEAVKHEKDANNPLQGRIKSAKKAFLNADSKVWRELRERLWKQILVEIRPIV